MANPTESQEIRPIKYVQIDQGLSHALFLSPPTRAYQFLHRSGEVIRIQEGQSGVPHALTTTDWPTALLLALQYDASYIVSFWKRKILFRVDNPHGAPSWWPAVVAPADLSIYNHSEQARREPDEHGNQPKRKQLSGAQKRKKYGPPPSYFNRRHRR